MVKRSWFRGSVGAGAQAGVQSGAQASTKSTMKNTLSSLKSSFSAKSFDEGQITKLQKDVTDTFRNIKVQNNMDRLKQTGKLSDNTFDTLSEKLAKNRESAQKAANELKRAKKSGDPGEIQKAANKLHRANKKLKNMDTALSKFADGIDDATFKKLTKLTDDAAENSTKSANWCMKNGNFDKCVMGGLGMAVGGYYSLEAYEDLEDEKKQCLNLCFPDDYREAVKSGRVPTYKTENAVSPFDPEVKYAVLYPDLKDSLCTRENMTKLGVNNCDDFCKVKCDYDLDDFFEQVAGNVADDAGGIIQGTMKAIFGDHWKIYVSLMFVVICVLLMIPFILKFSS